MARPGGLGRGLGALIPTGVVSNDEVGLQEIPISAIRPNPQQPREHFDEESLAALAESIREVGVLQPVLVRAGGDGYELIAGERRWRAARRIGLQTIPAIVRVADDAAMLQQAIVENVQREELNPLEEAAAYQQLIEDFSLTHDDVAARVGKSRATITNTLRLLQLPPSIQRCLKERHAAHGPRPRAARHARPRVPGTARQARGRRGPVGPRGRGGDPQPRGVAGRPGAPSARGDASCGRRVCSSSRSCSATTSRRGSGSRWARGAGGSQIDFANLEDLERIYRVMTEGGREPRLIGPRGYGAASSGSSMPRRMPVDERAGRRSGSRARERRPRRRRRRAPTSSHTTAAIRVSRRSR